VGCRWRRALAHSFTEATHHDARLVARDGRRNGRRGHAPAPRRIHTADWLADPIVARGGYNSSRGAPNHETRIRLASALQSCRERECVGCINAQHDCVEGYPGDTREAGRRRELGEHRYANPRGFAHDALSDGVARAAPVDSHDAETRGWDDLCGNES